MSFRAWIIAVAFGLIAGLGQAQEQTDGPQGEAETQQEPAQAYPIPFPVVVVEDQAAADARKRGEDESSQREIEDLAAQQGMNAATQSIKAATDDMRDYALYSTIIVGVGTALLVWTLWLTRQANRAAIAAVDVTREIGRTQARAYIHFPSAQIYAEPGTGALRVQIEIRNFGQTPARDIRRAQMQAAAKDIPDHEILADFGPQTPCGDIGPLQSVFFTFPVDQAAAHKINSGDSEVRQIKWVGEVVYRDAFMRQFKSYFAFRTSPGERIEPRVLHSAGYGNHST